MCLFSSCDVNGSDTSLSHLLSDYSLCIDADYRYVEPVLALRAVMASAVLRRASSQLKDKSIKMPSQESSACRDQVTSLFQSVSDTLIQQVQLAIKAKRFEVHHYDYVHTLFCFYISIFQQSLM